MGGTFDESKLPKLSVDEAIDVLGKISSEAVRDHALTALDNLRDPFEDGISDETQAFLESQNLPSTLPADYQAEMPDIRLHAGSLRIESGDRITCDMLIVTGDLVASCVVQPGHYHDSGAIVVLGQLVAENVVAYHWLIVQGDLTAKHMYANSSNDCGVIVGGSIQVVSLMETGSYIFSEGNLTAKIVVSLHNEIAVGGRMSAEKLRVRGGESNCVLSAVFKDSLIETDHYTDGVYNDVEPGVAQFEYPNGDAYVELLSAGGNPLR
jgi:hypothetical protein